MALRAAIRFSSLAALAVIGVSSCTTTGPGASGEAAAPAPSALDTACATLAAGTDVSAIVEAGERFEFRDLEAGRWRLRVAAIGAETLEQDIIAMTAPPPLELRLLVKSGVQPEHNSTTGVVTVDQLYPALPGR